MNKVLFGRYVCSKARRGDECGYLERYDCCPAETLVTIPCTTDGAVHGSAIGQPDEHHQPTDFWTRFTRNYGQYRRVDVFVVLSTFRNGRNRVTTGSNAIVMPTQHPTRSIPNRPRTTYNYTRIYQRAYLPGVEVNRDQLGGSSRARLVHCTTGSVDPCEYP